MEESKIIHTYEDNTSSLKVMQSVTGKRGYEASAKGKLGTDEVKDQLKPLVEMGKKFVEEEKLE